MPVTKKLQVKNKIKNATDILKEINKSIGDASKVYNGLQEAIIGFTAGGIGDQVSQVDTLFKGNRWYYLSNMRQLLAEIYVEHGLVQTLVDVPVNDALRGGVDIKTKQLSPEEVEQITHIMDKFNILTAVVGQSQKWNRLFGGAGSIVATGQPPEEPFEIEIITKDEPILFRAVDMWELYSDRQNLQGDLTPIKDELVDQLEDPKLEYYQYYSHRLHKTRVHKLMGITAPSFTRPRLRGWGLSVIEALARGLNQYLKTDNLTFEVLDEFKLDIYKIKGLTETLLSSDGTAKIQQRVQLANSQKNFQNAVTMDSEDDYQQKQLSFAGVSDVEAGNRIKIASQMRMPLTKIFGISAAGFNSGEDDIENYNAMVESEIRQKAKGQIIEIVQILSQREFGFYPDDLQVVFKPLRILSSEQVENVKTQKFNRLLAAASAGRISQKTFLDGCNKDELLGVQVDDNEEFIEPVQQEENKTTEEGKAPKSTLSAPDAKEPKV